MDIRYERNDIAFERNMFRVRGDTVEIWPAYWKDTAIRVEFFGDEIDRISEINVVTGTPIRRLNNIPIWPATHYVTPKEKMDRGHQGDLQGAGGAGQVLRGTGQGSLRRSASASAPCTMWR